MACNAFSFPTASESRTIADLRIMQAEICALQVAILDAREAGLREVTVCDSPMATQTIYWQAWQDGEVVASCDTSGSISTLLSRIEGVECYFENLGYIVTLITNPATNNTFCWVIRW
jgi:hypothetical protein